jgi:hypothetical protein
VRVHLQAARQRRVRRLVVRRRKHPLPAQGVDDDRGAQVAAIGVDDVTRAPVHLGDLDLRVVLVVQQRTQLAVVERRERPGQVVADARVRRVDQELGERLPVRAHQPERAQPLGRHSAGGRLALADLVAVHHHHARARARELAGD